MKKNCNQILRASSDELEWLFFSRRLIFCPVFRQIKLYFLLVRLPQWWSERQAVHFSFDRCKINKPASWMKAATDVHRIRAPDEKEKNNHFSYMCCRRCKKYTDKKHRISSIVVCVIVFFFVDFFHFIILLIFLFVVIVHTIACIMGLFTIFICAQNAQDALFSFESEGYNDLVAFCAAKIKKRWFQLWMRYQAAQPVSIDCFMCAHCMVYLQQIRIWIWIKVTRILFFATRYGNIPSSSRSDQIRIVFWVNVRYKRVNMHNNKLCIKYSIVFFAIVVSEWFFVHALIERNGFCVRLL